MKLGMIGFGEAAHALASGLRSEGLQDLYAWSLAYLADPAEAGVQKLSSAEEVFQICDLVMVVVQGKAALSVAKACRPYMTTHHVYLDVSTSSVRGPRN